MLLAASPQALPRPAGESIRVLVVDDDDDMRFYLCGCLNALGYRDILEASDGTTALRLAHDPLVGLVVSDVVMPGLDGYALCRALKEDAETAGIPLLMVSGETRAPPACADGFMTKPFNTASLRAHVERLLSGPT